MAKQRTQVFELNTLGEVTALCRNLIEMKKRAPVSLKVMLAITVEREVQFVGNGTPPDLLAMVDSLLAPISSTCSTDTADPEKQSDSSSSLPSTT